MQTLYVVLGVIAGILAVAGLAALAFWKPSRSRRKEASTWDDTNYSSGGGGGPD